VFSPDGKTITPFALGFNNPYQLAIDPLALVREQPGRTSLSNSRPRAGQPLRLGWKVLNAPPAWPSTPMATCTSPHFSPARHAEPGQPGHGTVLVVGVAAADYRGRGRQLGRRHQPHRPQLAHHRADVLTFVDLTQPATSPSPRSLISSGLVADVENPTVPGTIFLDEPTATA